MIHGHHTTYSLQKCRCEPCRQAHATYTRERMRAKAAGRPYTTSSARARQHVKILLEAGFRQVEIERATGVSHPSLNNILHNPEKKIHRTTEEAILSTSQGDVYDHCREVPTTVPSRMLRQLAAMGWTHRDIARVAGVGKETVRMTRDRPRPRMHRSTAELIEVAYDRLVGLPLPRGVEATRVRGWAKRHGWEPPTPAVDHWQAAA